MLQAQSNEGTSIVSDGGAFRSPIESAAQRAVINHNSVNFIEMPKHFSC